MEIIMADEVELSDAEYAAARQSFLNDGAVSEPDEVIEPVVDTAAEEAAALDELTTPPAVPESEEDAVTPPVVSAPPGEIDPYAAFGGEEAVRLAYQVQEAMRTRDGVRALAAQSLQALGYSPQAIAAALAEQAPAAEAPAPVADDPFAGLDDEDVVTVAQTRQLVEQAVAAATSQAVAATQQQIEPLQAATLAAQQQQVQANTDAALVEAIGQPPTDPAELAAYRTQVDAIVQRGSQYYDPQQWANPNHIREAVRRASAELAVENEARFQAYLVGKKKARDAQPANIGGGAGGEGPLPEPKTMAEAQKQAREAGFFS